MLELYRGNEMTFGVDIWAFGITCAERGKEIPSFVGAALKKMEPLDRADALEVGLTSFTCAGHPFEAVVMRALKERAPAAVLAKLFVGAKV